MGKRRLDRSASACASRRDNHRFSVAKDAEALPSRLSHPRNLVTCRLRTTRPCGIALLLSSLERSTAPGQARTLAPRSNGYPTKTYVNAVTLSSANLSSFMQRLAHAHANCVEGFPDFGGCHAHLPLGGEISTSDPLGYALLGARLVQSTIHPLLTSPLAVSARFTAFSVQMFIAVYSVACSLQLSLSTGRLRSRRRRSAALCGFVVGQE
jgi:hypothetical protein